MTCARHLTSALIFALPCLAIPPAHAQTSPSQTTPGCATGADPYNDPACLDARLGSGLITRLWNYQRIEWGQATGPADPAAPPSRRADLPPAPQSTPPMPFTEWPYGGATSLGANRTASVDSPLMAALGDTGVGKLLADAGIQVYGWIDPGGNFSTNTQRKPGGNAPISYAYIPNTIQLDQAVLYIERTPDTVQTDHIDWGFRVSAIYGENYRYTTSFGLASYQYLKNNNVNGYDFPMLYAELYIPQLAQGLVLRLGRYIALPDIEAQLAPNNYMYTHSLTYAFDNYTNEGLQATLQVSPNLMLQAGISIGTEATVNHAWQTQTNQMPGNALYPGSHFPIDPGAVPSYTACARITWNDGRDNIYPCADAINGGQWGYNNVQWYGFTYYHKFNDQWHISTEFYDIHENGVPNVLGYVNNNGSYNQTAVNAFLGGGTPFSPQFIAHNAPNGANCNNPNTLRCNAYAVGMLAYINYSPDPLNNFSLRPELYDDPQGQRTGTAATYYDISLGWQHWFSPQVEMRPEIGYYRSNGAKAFNGGTTNHTLIGAADLILHF